MIDDYIIIEEDVGKSVETKYEDIFLTLFLDTGLYRTYNIRSQVKFYAGGKYIYRADFLLTPKDDPSRNIVVEIDGLHHRFNKEQRVKDYYRDKDMENSGFKVIRILNNELCEEALLDVLRIEKG